MGDRGGRRYGNPRRFAGRVNEEHQRNPLDIEEIARLQQRVRDLEMQHEECSEEDDGDYANNPFAHGGNPFEQRERKTDPFQHLGIKIGVPEFDGKADPDVFLDWLQIVEYVFDLRDISDEYKVKLIALKLPKYASMWWETVKKKRNREGNSKKDEETFAGRFLPPNFHQEAFLDYHNVAQRSSTVEAIISEFDRLRIRCGVEREEEQIIARFFGALKSEIANFVCNTPIFKYRLNEK
uniref:Retrotransposon gag domain-containing protein n=1 Tax=Lactuca sativa TaxID=4236 RepID=A0A9R1WUN2_LACSA|nr:hypothetical protein LSAT_V11C900503100 [Lactuca sativa]